MNRLFFSATCLLLTSVLVFGFSLTGEGGYGSPPAMLNRVDKKVKQWNISLPAYPATIVVDSDKDGIPDMDDVDDDNDGILDRDEVKCTSKMLIPNDIPDNSPDGTANSFSSGNYGGLNKPGIYSDASWSAPDNFAPGHFVGVVFPDPAKISSIDIRGRSDWAQWVTSFTLEGTKEPITTGSQGKSNTWISLGTFTGNSDQHTIVAHQVNSTEADWRAIRIVPKTWTGHPSLRFAVNICVPVADTETVLPNNIPANSPDGTANSFSSGNYGGLNKPGIYSDASWSAPDNFAPGHFVGVMFPDLAKISSIDIRGRENGGQWVTSFTLEGTKEPITTGSQGTKNTWISLGTFTGNSDQHTIVTYQINSTEADWRAIRIVPKTWNEYPSLRFAVNISLSGTDTDKDGVADQLDTDSDGDGLSDNEESQPTGSQIAKSGIDTDGDGVDNAYDPDNGGKTIMPVDTDGDSTPDYKDTDSDGDAILDKNEPTDDNNNGTPDYREVADSDSDGMSDLLDSDDDGDGISDLEEMRCEESFHQPQPFTSLAQAHGMPTGRYSFDLGNGVFQADVDDSEGGGWVLVLQYVHKGTTNPALKVLAAGTDFPVTSTAALGTDESTETTKWGHAGNAALSQFTEDFELRFHGATNAHARIIHFKAIPGSPGTSFTTYVKTGTGWFEGVNVTSRHTLLTGHTATLPVSADKIRPDQGDKALTHFPFYKESNYHWGIAGGSNSNRWEVDDFPGGSGGQSGSKNSTIHRVWVRSTTLPTAAPCTEADSDKDGIPNRTDGDSDGDGIADKDEIGTPPMGKDTDGDGVPDYLDADTDNDGITDIVEGQTTSGHKTPSGTDANKNGIDDVYEGLTPTDTDGDKIPDFKDTDTDGDNAPDWIEGFDNDRNGDARNDLIGRADAFKAAGGDPSFYDNSTDSDSDKIPDWLEDTNNGGKPNFLDKTSPHYHDSDGDGLVDLYNTDSKGTAIASSPKATSTEMAFRDASSETTLPVELLSFEATAKGGQVWVTWATATEENSDRFEIYRSTDGATWSQAGTVRAAGSSQAKLSYTFTDREPYEGVSYYRLRMVDFDGKEDVSPVRQVTVGRSLSRTDVNVWPNPNDGNFTISSTHTGSSPALLTLYSMVGHVVWEKELLSLEQTDEVVAGNIQAGTYLLHVSNATGVTVVKIIVQ